MTNRDRLDSMSNVELAEFLNGNTPDICEDCFCYIFCNNCKPYNSCESVIFRWLESEVEE